MVGKWLIKKWFIERTWNRWWMVRMVEKYFENCWGTVEEWLGDGWGMSKEWTNVQMLVGTTATTWSSRGEGMQWDVRASHSFVSSYRTLNIWASAHRNLNVWNSPWIQITEAYTKIRTWLSAFPKSKSGFTEIWTSELSHTWIWTSPYKIMNVTSGYLTDLIQTVWNVIWLISVW